jgi:hypothetical protein
MEGVKVRLRVQRNGSSEVMDGLHQVDPEFRAMLGVMPAVLPALPVRVGESWSRDLPLPSDSTGGGNMAVRALRAKFRLDSLTSDGALAWISLDGAVTPQSNSAASQPGMAGMSGSVRGTLILDRRRGWLAESRALVTIESLVTLPDGGPPLRVHVRVNQVMRTAPGRN